MLLETFDAPVKSPDAALRRILPAMADQRTTTYAASPPCDFFTGASVRTSSGFDFLRRHHAVTVQQFPAVLRETPDGSAADLRDIVPKNEPAAVVPDDPEAFVCRSCRKVITRAAERIMVQGAHEHTCANPAGLLYRIGCFRAAECSYAGEPTQEWTWFRGFGWQVAMCRHCCGHVGWRFSAAGREFHGLILDRLCAEPHGMP